MDLSFLVAGPYFLCASIFEIYPHVLVSILEIEMISIEIHNFTMQIRKTRDQVLDKSSKHVDRYKNKFKFFLWPNYQLEDLADMNCYWFDTNNNSHFSMLRIHMCP